MGVTFLWQKLNSTKEQIPIASLEGQKIAIDVSLWLHGAEKGCGTYVYNRAENPAVTVVFKRLVALRSHGIQPIVVFDGAIRRDKLRVFDDLESQQTQTMKVEADTLHFSDTQNFRDCKKLCELLHVQYVQAPGEAEAQCANMEVNKLISGTVTKDSDYFLFGGSTLFHISFEKTIPLINRVTMQAIQNKFYLNRNDLIGMSLFLGCDFYAGVTGIGFMKAQKIIHYFKKDGDTPLAPIKRFIDSVCCDEPPAKTSKVGNLETKFYTKLRSEKSQIEVTDMLKYDIPFMNPRVLSKVELNEDDAPLTSDNLESLFSFISEKNHWQQPKFDTEINRLRKYDLKGLPKLHELGRGQKRMTDYLTSVKKSVQESNAPMAKESTPKKVPQIVAAATPRKRKILTKQRNDIARAANVSRNLESSGFSVVLKKTPTSMIKKENI